MSIVALGTEREAAAGGAGQPGLVRSYLRGSGLVAELGSPAPSRLRARILGGVRLELHECPRWVRPWGPPGVPLLRGSPP